MNGNKKIAKNLELCPVCEEQVAEADEVCLGCGNEEIWDITVYVDAEDRERYTRRLKAKKAVWERIVKEREELRREHVELREQLQNESRALRQEVEARERAITVLERQIEELQNERNVLKKQVLEGHQKYEDRDRELKRIQMELKELVERKNKLARGSVAGSVVENSIGMEMVLIPAGTFRMGSNSGDNDERPVHEVTISQPFYLGKYPVTQGEWEAVMGDNPSHFKGDARLPVEMVSWEDCQEFIRRLNAQEAENTYRLPSEAEWEYACRAGTGGEYAGSLDVMGWYGGNSGGKTHPVGQKQANRWGLYDMHGNVWEWCADWKGDYPDGRVMDPVGPSEGSYRGYRGGGWNNIALFCRSADRGWGLPGDCDYNVGFRLLKML